MKIIIQNLIGIFICLLPLNVQGVEYLLQDLGTLAADESYVSGINNQNAIVGYMKQAKETSNFIWEQDKGLIFLPHPHYQAPLINKHNQVVDIFWYKTDYWVATNMFSKHIYLFDNGHVQDLGAGPKQWKLQEIEEGWKTPSVWDEKDLGIVAFNDLQQILIANNKYLSFATRYAIWQKGEFKEVDEGVIDYAYAMNNQGVILARKWIKKNNTNIPMLVLYNPVDNNIVEITEDLDFGNRKLNDLGQVILVQIRAAAIKDVPPKIKGFLWDPEKGLTELEDFAPVVFNNCGQMIGLQISQLLDKKIVPLLRTPEITTPLFPWLK